jgi:regulator of sirC expression with transglutaminase-like and TPR domain
MYEGQSLTLFAHVCSRPEPELDLAEAALLLGDIAYGDVDVASGVAELDALGRAAKRSIDRVDGDAARVEALLQFLYGESGFHGNQADYYDPRNSFVGDVLARRTGIPISLALVIVEVARRAGVEAQGVSFPSHFLVRSPVPGGMLVVDPFEGRLLGVNELRGLYARAIGSRANASAPRDVPPKLLEPAPKKQILLRMLTNLRGVYASTGDEARVRQVLERVEVLCPNDDTRRELERLGGRAGAAPASRVLN